MPVSPQRHAVTYPRDLLDLVLEGIADFSEYDDEQEDLGWIDTRADMIEQVEILETKAHDLLATRATIQATLPLDKLG